MFDLGRFRLHIYTYRFLYEAMPIYVFYALIFAETGLSSAQISSLFFIWGLTAIIAELPTGIIADKYSRKYSLILGGVLRAAAFGIWLASPTYLGFMIGFIVWAIGGAFQSGAFEAYLYDQLKSRGKSAAYGALYARCEGLTLVGMVVAYISAIMIGQSNITLLLSISIFISLLCSFLAFRFPKEPITKDDNDHVSSRVVRTALGHVRRSPRLRRHVLTLVILGSILGAIEEFIPLYYKAVGLESTLNATVMTAGIATSALLALALKSLHQVGTWKLLVGLGGVAGLVIIGSLLPTPLAVIAMFIFMRALIVSEIAFSASFQDEISSQVRATTGSLVGLGDELVGTLLIAGYGLVTLVGGDIGAIQAFMILTILASTYLALFWRKPIAAKV